MFLLLDIRMYIIFLFFPNYSLFVPLFVAYAAYIVPRLNTFLLLLVCYLADSYFSATLTFCSFLF